MEDVGLHVEAGEAGKKFRGEKGEVDGKKTFFPEDISSNCSISMEEGEGKLKEKLAVDGGEIS